MVNVIVNMGMTDRQKKWSQFVEMNKYFHAPLTCSRSAPCLQIVRKMRSAPAFGTTNLSLSWQLACNPAGSSHLNDDCVQRSHSSKHVAKNLKCLKSSGKRKAKLKPKMKPKDKTMVNPGAPPKIMVVNVIKKGPIRDDQHDLEKRSKRVNLEDTEIRLNRENCKDREERPYNKPDQPTATRAKKPRAEVVAKPKRNYGVPLCYRPTTLLGPRYYTDLQYYNQQQYYNQIQEQQQLMQQNLYYKPMQHLSKTQQDYFYEGRYAVPIESIYHNVKKGSRYCGNFYYR